jgi:hypothetical protein
MGTRGRKSANELLTQSPVMAVMRRPEAPLDLTPEEADVWNRTTDAMPADWFMAESHPLLVQFCRHTVTARRVAQLIDAEMSRPDVKIGTLKDLLSMQQKETASLKAMAASLRLSQQASYSARGAGGEKDRRTTVARPWE